MTTTTGFLLTRLSLFGSGVPHAEVRFNAGLNVIFGPSDTGKTLVGQCVDFMLGGSKEPKEIPEAALYEYVLLGFRAPDSENELVLERSLRGGDFRLRIGEQDRTLGAKHQADNEDTLSYFLLDLAGLSGRRIRTNKQGKTRTLSFRDVAKLVLVDEETVISERSPIFSGQGTAQTAERSVFRLLLTGVDDSSVIARDDPKIVKGRQEGKSEVIESLLAQAKGEIADLKLDSDPADLRGQLKLVEARFQKASSALAVEQKSVAVLEEERHGAWTRLRQAESRMDVLSELQKRFELLQKQYSSDLRRLESISEAGVRLGQMKEERCPVCGAPAEHHDRAHQEPHAAPEEVATASRAEAQKIRTLLADLRGTVAENEAEVTRLSEERREKQAELEAAAGELRDRLRPRMQAALQKFWDCQSQRDTYRHALELYDRVAEFEALLTEFGKPKKVLPADGPSVAVGANQAEQFSKHVEALLRAWHFPNLDRVTFSEDDQDVVISGHRRASHGKGVRAITHAAFNLALLRYCRARSMPHPGFVLIDSPLVVYREPDTGEGSFTRDVKDAFYRSLAKSFGDAQVIILENEEPPADLDRSANLTEFTGTDRGRKGFVPQIRE